MADYEDTDDDQTLPFSEPSEFEPSDSDSDSDVSDLDHTLGLQNLNIGEFETEEAQDDDYGALDFDVVDTQVGSYNAGDNDDAWRSCLQFFNINPDEYLRQTAVRPSAGQARRVPMKKLPGMSIGLFDYQLIAVLNLLKFTLNGVAGGLLCDEQGLGKTQEMFGVIGLAYNLRRSKAEVLEAYKKDDYRLHNRPNNSAVSCRADDRYGIQCYCHSQLTKQLADRLPDGLNLVVAPARSCTQFLREAKTKLDTKVFKLKSAHSSAERDNKLTPVDINSLRATVTAAAASSEQSVKYHYQVKPNQHNYILFVPSETLKSLMYVDFSVDVKVPKTDGAKLVKMSGLLPGLVMLDEFHEYTGPSAPQNNKLIPWLKHLKACSEASQRASPLVFFASGTPFGESPIDIRDAIDLFSLDPWIVKDSDPLVFFDNLTETFYSLTDQQAAGETVPREDIIRYRRDLDAILSKLMVRRLGTDTFRGRPLTALGPLKVSIVDHQLPAALIPHLQALADRTRNTLPTSAVLHSTEQGQALLLRLRLASTFPGIALAPSTFTFTDDEVTTLLSSSNNNPLLTPYNTHITTWSTGSPKLSTITSTITTMLTDTAPIPGESTSAKKLLLFSPLESESLLLHLYLLTQQQQKSPHLVPRLKPVHIHSGMSPSTRQAVIDKFLQPGNAPPNVLIAPMALAGTGLNLHKANYAIVTSPAWTRRENQQAYFRIHRVGQRQETKLQLLTCRWNPAERVILGRYEGRGVGEDEEEEEVWVVDNRFVASGSGEAGRGVVDRHNLVEE
ncbi:hypothetical protein B0T19DRAFT_361664 [Cercophora scortea]|uniref:Helicase C-terminal domain-containing protein n=1 Tax=Cercophora scortea TaxID=314031 RepID=A0AAE0I809_9PEZI|nr:hypothetical protein B0T19DRAFT_361664 [Cercophora scortea]